MYILLIVICMFMCKCAWILSNFYVFPFSYRLLIETLWRELRSRSSRWETELLAMWLVFFVVDTIQILDTLTFIVVNLFRSFALCIVMTLFCIPTFWYPYAYMVLYSDTDAICCMVYWFWPFGIHINFHLVIVVCCYMVHWFTNILYQWWMFV